VGFSALPPKRMMAFIDPRWRALARSDRSRRISRDRYPNVSSPRALGHVARRGRSGTRPRHSRYRYDDPQSSRGGPRRLLFRPGRHCNGGRGDQHHRPFDGLCVHCGADPVLPSRHQGHTGRGCPGPPIQRRIIHLEASISDNRGEQVAMATGSFGVCPSRNGSSGKGDGSETPSAS